MAYILYYTCNFHNELNELVENFIYKKDGDPDTVTVNYPCTQWEVSCRGDNDDVTDTIITRELLMKLFVPHDDTGITWEALTASQNDEYMVHSLIDSQHWFHGFVVPDESPTDFQDKPYQLTIRCTDGLRLLQQVELTEPDGSPFDCGNLEGNVDYLMGYVVTCLRKTGFDLPIRFYCNIYESSFTNRTDDPLNLSDAFNQAAVERRAFSKNVTEMKSCWDVLQAILHGFRLAYQNGDWWISRIGELQYNPGDKWYTKYNADGSLPDGQSVIDAEGYARVGKEQVICPVNVNQMRSSRFAAKTVKHSFPYIIWDEIPANSKFERGTFFDTGDQPDDTDYDGDGNLSEIIGIYKRYTIDCWNYGKDTQSGLPGPSPTTGTAYRKSVYNQFGIELYREIELTAEVTGTALFCILESYPIPVDIGDIIELSFQFRVETAGGLTGISASYAYIKPDDGSAILFLDNNNGVLTDKCLWEASTGILQLQYAGADPTKYFPFSAKSVPVTKTGKLYFGLFGGNTATYGKKFFKDFNVTYTPYISGGYIPITGDYWTRTNPLVFSDAIDEQVSISDSLKKIVKGSLLRLDKSTLTNASWYRLGLTESRHYKELINLAFYNLKYRRFWKIEGDFRGTKYQPENEASFPVSFHQLYRFIDIPEEKYFLLCTPFRMDGLKGIFQGTFIEIKDAALPDGTQEPAAVFNYTFSNQ